jgi:hypothetical protein
MDEYFEVLQRLADETPTKVLRQEISDIVTLRANGWAKKRLELVGAASPTDRGVPKLVAPVRMVAIPAAGDFVGGEVTALHETHPNESGKHESL